MLGLCRKRAGDPGRAVLTAVTGVALQRPDCIWGGALENVPAWKNNLKKAQKTYANVNCYLLGDSCILGPVLGTLCELQLILPADLGVRLCQVKAHEAVTAT